MVKTLEALVEFLSENLDGNVKSGYASTGLKAPVTEPGVYITLAKTEISTSSGKVGFSALVYSPPENGGSGCVRLAEEVAVLLLRCRDVTVGDLNVSNVKYNDSSGAFVMEITGSAKSTDSEEITLSAVKIRAHDFENSPQTVISVSAAEVNIQSGCSVYPIMTICSDVPVEQLRGAAKYTVTLGNVPHENTLTFFSGGKFTLTVDINNDTIEFTNCRCISESFDSKSDANTSKLVITSYEKRVSSSARI